MFQSRTDLFYLQIEVGDYWLKSFLRRINCIFIILNKGQSKLNNNYKQIFVLNQSHTLLKKIVNFVRSGAKSFMTNNGLPIL